MQENNRNEEQIEKRDRTLCLIGFAIIIFTTVFLFWIVKVLVWRNNSDIPTLLTRKATMADVSIAFDDSNIISIEVVVEPKCDIEDFEITINYYTGNDVLLKTTTKNFGDIKKEGRYTEQIYLTDFSLSQIMLVEYCQYTVTGGLVSHFR